MRGEGIRIRFDRLVILLDFVGLELMVDRSPPARASKMWLLDFATVHCFGHCENACSNHLWQYGPGGNNLSKIGIGRGRLR